MANELMPVLNRAISSVKGVQVTKNSMVFPEKMSYEQWEDAGNRIAEVEEGAQWWLGDWFAYGENAFPSEHAQAVTGKSYQTIKNVTSVCKRVTPEVRRATLSFRHHEVVAKFHKSPEHQKAFLDIAERENLTSDEFRARVKQIEAEADKNRPVADGGDTGEGEPGEETVGTPETYVPTGVTTKSIIGLVREHLTWADTKELMLALREYLADEGIACEVTFDDGTDPRIAVSYGMVQTVPDSSLLSNILASLPEDAPKKDVTAASRLVAFMKEREEAEITVSVSGAEISGEEAETAEYRDEADTVDETETAEEVIAEIERVPVEDESTTFAIESEPEEVVAA